MNKKNAVTIKPYERTEYAYDKLRVCRKCGSYTVLSQKVCPACGKRTLTDVPSAAKREVRRSMQSERLFAVLLALLAMFFADTIPWMAISAAAGLLLTAMLWVVQRRTTEAQIRIRTDRMFARDQNRIRHGMIQDIKAAEGLLEARPALAYEMLREVNTLLRNDPIRNLQAELLQTFVLRRDMDLLLEPLIMDGFSPHLAGYIGEVAKLNRELIKESAIRYCLRYEPQIRGMHRGEDILAAVAGAAVRMKRYIELYPEFIRRYTYKLPAERLERLREVISQHPGSFEQLKLEAEAVHRLRFGGRDSHASSNEGGQGGSSW
ncbi:hypothetical protein [Saccharibacillus alkalitolerans]|uniref:Zinc ribbon domain-containing protein n=1 Tax=Saccharibacillus alkalitolerans TaxID=2705290 RepID=A0ABX0FCH4_9BACL|nr:hypothetical protein [Saccharibacillus alkalitolerans]NGZ78028.1 hypothetical protein [Saccharibacillus alkalitolerans]